MNEGFGQFLQRAAQHRILTAREEKELAKRIEAGDHKAKQKLIEHNVKLAVHIAKRYTTDDIPLEDLVQEALIGVDRAATKFDWRKDIKFSTYATWWIRHMIQRALLRDRATIRVPGHIRARQVTLRAYMDKNPEATIEEAAANCEKPMSVEHAKEALSGAQVVASLDAPFLGESTGDRYDLYADESSPDPADVISDSHPGLSDALKKLTPFERRVVELRFGLSGNSPLGRDETATELGVKPHAVQRAQKSAIARLKGELANTVSSEV
jgi:RNA polymerase sigma factor (sigma-70 family)